MGGTVSQPLGLALLLGKIVAVGRNFRAHAHEMGAAVPSEPLLFLKPSTACTQEPDSLVLPDWSSDVHHEVELVVRVGKTLRDATPSECVDAIESLGVALDLTARDHQSQAKKEGKPWAVSKGFDASAPISMLFSAVPLEVLKERSIRLRVNGELRQEGKIGDMIFDVPTLLAAASRRFSLEAGDLLLCGTPQGVGPLRAGDEIAAELEGVAELLCNVQRSYI